MVEGKRYNGCDEAMESLQKAGGDDTIAQRSPLAGCTQVCQDIEDQSKVKLVRGKRADSADLRYERRSTS